MNVVAHTFVNTGMSARMLAYPDFYQSLVSRIPLGRMAEPEDVMQAVLFFITGQTLYVDGGITATQ